MNVEALEVAPNIEFVLAPPPKLPKLLPKLGVPPNTGFELVVVLPNSCVLLEEAKPPPKGLLWVASVLFANTLEVEVLAGSAERELQTTN